MGEMLLVILFAISTTDRATAIEPTIRTAETLILVTHQWAGPIAGVLAGAGNEATGIAWPLATPYGVCDDEQDCADKLQELCETVNSDLVDGSAKIDTRPDGGKICHGECVNGAIPFAECLPAGVIDDPDPAGRLDGLRDIML